MSVNGFNDGKEEEIRGRLMKGEFAERTSGDICKEEEEKIKEFCHQLIKLSQCREVKSFLTGSLSEIPGQQNLFHRYELNRELMDADFMYCVAKFYLVTSRDTVPYQFNDSVVRIYSRGLHAGYVRLFDETNNRELKISDFPLDLRGAKQGPAATLNIADQGEIFQDQFSSKDWRASNHSTAAMQDFVVAVHCRYWPPEVNEWITRPRQSGVPSKSVIKDIVKYGCDFVQVSHKLSKDDNEWRFSFSKAELLITRSWTTSQRSVYRTLHTFVKMIKSRVNDSKLCTYYFKTLMLWATEEKLSKFWAQQHILVDSVSQLLLQQMQWLKIKFCPNYFIPSNNMMDHLIDTDIAADIDALYQLLQNRFRIYDVLTSSIFFEVHHSNEKYSIDAPVWVYTSLIIGEQINYSEEIFTRLFSQNSALLINHTIATEMSDIYHGLYSTNMVSNCLIQSVDDINSYMRKSIVHYQSYGILHDMQHNVVQCCSSTVALRLLVMWFKECAPDSSSLLVTHKTSPAAEITNGLCIKNTMKKLLYSQSMNDTESALTPGYHFNESKCCKHEVSIVSNITSTVDNYTNVTKYIEFQRMSPTVNISWFINKAYLANLYYTTQLDYNATEQICDNIIHVFKQSVFNRDFAEDLLPVILSTEWTSVNDVELQVILGLYSLCSFMVYKTDRSRSVCLGVCPVLFAMYLKFCCAAQQMDIEKWKRYQIKIFKHFKNCKGDRRVQNGRLAVKTALIVYERRVRVLLFNHHY